MKNLLTTIVVLLCGCANSSQEHIQQTVNDAMKENESYMSSDYSADSANFAKVYKHSLKETNDSILRREKQKLYVLFSGTLAYIDSIKYFVKKVDDNDINNIGYIKEKFLHEGLADSLFIKIKLAYISAEAIASTKKQKEEIVQSGENILGNSNTGDRKLVYFKSSGPKGTYLILYGIQKEMLKVGVGYFKDH
jgi:hypothetical protein